jgi:DNA-binding beta-propeller fold protein YncE
MRWWRSCTILTVAVALGTIGCKGSSSTSSSGVTLTITPVVASVIRNTSLQFASLVIGSSDTTVKWEISGSGCGTAGACGTIDSNGLYQAPAAIPNPATVTITATSNADNNQKQSATLTIISGLRMVISPTSATLGTGENFTFTATVSNPGCDTTVPNNTCLAVTWSLPTTGGVGSIASADATHGVYTAPATVPSPNTVTVTATAADDTTVTSTATVTIQTSADPTLTSVSPGTAARGSVFQDVYVTGTNFSSTTKVFINGVAVDPQNVFDASPSVLRVRIPAATLAAPPPSGILEISASTQVGTPQTCTNAPDCQVVIVGVRPAVTGPSPNSIPQGSGGVLNFNVNGGFFGQDPNAAVTATYDGLPRAVQISPTNVGRQMSVIIGGSSNPGDFGTPGLHPVVVHSSSDPSKMAATNLAVQPDFAANPIAPVAGSPLPVGSGPTAVAINPTTGLAVVANHDSNDVTLIDLTTPSPTVVVASICTAAVGAVAPCPSSGPNDVAVDYNRNIALVANTLSKNVAVIDLTTKAVTAVIPIQDPPVAVGVNPVTGRALVAVQSRNYAVLINLTQPTPVIAGTVTIATGPKAHIAVEPHLNWAVATPGNVGSLGIVDLNRQTTIAIASVSRTSGTVTVNVQASTTSNPQPPLQVQAGDAVMIQGVSDNSFNGIYNVNSAGPGNTTFTYTQVADSSHPDVAVFNTTGSVSYAEPVATLAVNAGISGIGISPETQQAILLNPNVGCDGTSNPCPVTILSLLDQSVSSFTPTDLGSMAGAFNPLTDTAFVVSSISNRLAAVDPSTPKLLPDANTSFATGNRPVAVAVDPATNTAVVVNQGDNTVSVFSLGPATRPVAITETSPKTVNIESTLSSAATSSAQTLTVIGKGFTNTSQVSLDGTALTTAFVSDRKLTAVIPSSLLTTARRFAVDVSNAGGVFSNVSDFTVTQSVDVATGTGCSVDARPTGVSIDPDLNLAVVSLSGCNTAALIDLASGTGKTVAVGSNPAGVAVLPSLHMAVVANQASGTASVIDELQQTVTNTVTTGAGALGVAADDATGEAAVANSVANTVTVFNVSSGSTSTTISTGQTPVAVAFNYATHQIGVAAAGGNSVGFGDAAGTGLTTNFGINLPTSIVYDPVANNFLVNSSTGNLIESVDPTTQSQSGFRVGINPTSIGYNYLTSTLVSTNTLSHTVTVVDSLARQVRAVLNLPAPPSLSTLALSGSVQFGVAIHPLTNLMVIADTANNRVLFVPAPR